MARDIFKNQSATTVSSGGTDAPGAGTAQTWTVASTASFPVASNTASPPTVFYVVDEDAPTEVIKVTNTSGVTWTVERGADNTTPVSHVAGFLIKNVVPAAWLQKVDDRVAKDVYNVLDFGALGDDANNDHGGIQGALDAARDNNGGVVYIPKGNYRLATFPLKVYDGTHVIAHPQAHIKNYANTSSMVWNGTGGDTPTGYNGNGNITIEGGIWDQRGGVWLDGAACFSFAHGKNLTWRNVVIRDVADTHAIEINGCQNVRIEDCAFEGFYATAGREYSEAVQLDLMKSSSVYGAFGAYDNTPCDDVVIQNCRFVESDDAVTHKWGRGVGSHSGTIGKWHTNVRIIGNYFNVNHEAVRGYSWQNTVVANNILQDCGAGIELRSIPYNGTPSEDTKDASGVQQNTSQSFQDFTIIGNVIRGSGSGDAQPAIHILGEATGIGYNGAITGNLINDCPDDGIYVTNGDNITISGNNVVSSGLYGILVDNTNHATISSNKVNAPGYTAIGSFTNTQNLISGNHIRLAWRHGIYTSNDNDTCVVGNYVHGASRAANATYSAYYNDGSSTVDNQWLNNSARLVGSGNEYQYGMRFGGGTHTVRYNNIEAGTAARYNTVGGVTVSAPVEYS